MIIISTPREEKLAKSFIESLRDPKRFIEYTYTPLINPDALFIKRLNVYISGGRKSIPKRIVIPIPQEGTRIELPVSFYTQDKQQFRLVDVSRKRVIREARTYDIIFRYLPGMIRPITKNYIVTNIRVESGRREVQLDELTQHKLEEVWGQVSRGPLRLDLVNKGLLFTISDVSIEFKPHSLRTLYGRDLDLIEVFMKPLGVKLIRKDYRKIMLEEKGRLVEVQIPVFMLLGYKPLDEDLREKLSVHIVTRGIYTKEY